MKKRTFFSAIFLTILLLTGAYAYSNKQYLKDSYVVHSEILQPQAAALLPSLDLTQQGEFYYKASKPEVESATQFNDSCRGAIHEQTIVLGCYTMQRVFVFDVNDPRLDGVKQVTAAHELPPAAYERLSASEKQELNKELLTAAASINDERFNQTLEQYKKTEPDQIENELHSILGTEIEVLPAPLEAHYKKYFNDRAKIVAYAKQYEKTFSDLENQIKNYDTQLTTMLAQKKQLEGLLGTQQIAIESQRRNLDELKSTDQIAQYNALVPGFNQQVNDYNQKVAQLKDLVVQYNAIVEQRNSLAATQNELAKKLDSSYQPIQ